jgi:glycosyltransferase involved in cell wall biosynthesis
METVAPPTPERWPRVSFAMPLLNAGKLIEEALQSIRSQDYPDVEIVIADGMSTDNTRDICRKYNCVIVDNLRVEAEIGVELARERATGEFIFVMAADNACPHSQWIKQMIAPFLADSRIIGVYPRMVPAPNDTSVNTYLCELHVDPFTWFVFGNTAHPDHFKRAYPVLLQQDGFIVYQFNVKRFPLIAWAQGFGVRKSYKRDPATIGDDILPIIQMIEQGQLLAYVPKAGVYHHHLTGFRSFLKKYRARVLGNLYRRAFGMHNRTKYISPERKLRSYLWLVYGCTLIGPLFHALFWFARSGKTFWLWHFPANVCLTYITVFEVFRFYVRKLFGLPPPK